MLSFGSSDQSPKWILQRYMYRVLTQMTPPQFLRNNAFIYPWHDLHRRARPRAISAGPTRVHWTEFAAIDTIYPNVLAFLESGRVWGIRIRIYKGWCTLVGPQNMNAVCLGRALPDRNLLGEWTFIFRVVLAHDTHLRKLISSSSKYKSLSCGSMFRRDVGIFGKHICGTTGTGKKLSSGTIRCMSQFP